MYWEKNTLIYKRCKLDAFYLSGNNRNILSVLYKINPCIKTCLYLASINFCKNDFK